MIDDFRLRVFCQVAQEQNFTKAAKVLGVTQSAVSQNISTLEKDAGHQLLQRDRNGVFLTEKGEKFIKYAQQILHWYDSANEALENDFNEEAAEIELNEETRLEIFSSCGDIHIRLKKQ